ncbi:hypothetical protein LARV_03902 [Longilinea arvoryzae]|uniref:Uncharacterized protein n=1 Tax=Longilinea arvoryzae TaxID=360412 RepID=A0A0K8MYI8_9CHLR|nr:hypothetical protein [Longilinea arvoryzae]GAP16106.1 hypothetical protein LARV_03902 [Longilinea arvoryzae]
MIKTIHNRKVEYLVLLLLVISGCNYSSLQDNQIPADTNDKIAPSSSIGPLSTRQTVDRSTISTEQQIQRKIALTMTRTDSIFDAMFFFDHDLNLVNSIDTETYPYLSSMGCQVINISDDQRGFVITTRDFNGNILKRAVALEKRNKDDRIFGYSISPSEQWIAYLVITGDWGMSYDEAEIQDVRLLKIDAGIPQTAKLLTIHGGARANLVIWSPDNHYLAYTDFDENKSVQAFMYDLLTGESLQISHFGNEKETEQIIDLKWSIDSKYLAIATSVNVGKKDGKSNTGAVHLFRVSDNNLQTLNLKMKDVRNAEIQWGDAHRLLVLLITQKNIQTNPDFALIWFDVEKNAISRKLTQMELGINQVFSALPLTDDLNQTLIEGSSAPYLFIYNYEKGELINKEQKLMDGLYQFVETSSGFLRSPGCKE